MTLAARGPEYTSQGTQIEQARATADVLAAMEAAKRWPRDLDAVKRDMLAVCQTDRVARSAFWSVPRGRDTKTGSTVQLMRTIAAIFGNLSFGARQLHRDERNRHTEMQAWAWDLQSNTRIEETFIVPWIVDLRGGESRPSKSETEIRELCSAVAQRKVRVQIANVLPDWYVAEAEDTALAVIEQRNRKIEDVRKDVGEMLAPLGIPLANVLHRVGREKWGDTLRGDLAVLRIAGEQIIRGEASAAELFPAPPAKVDATVATARQAGAKSVGEHAAEQPPADLPAVDTPEPDGPAVETPPEPSPPMTGKTRSALMAIVKDAGLDPRKDRDRRHRLCEILADRMNRPLTDEDGLTEAEATLIVETLRLRKDAEQLVEFVATTLREDEEARAADAARDDNPSAEPEAGPDNPG